MSRKDRFNILSKPYDHKLSALANIFDFFIISTSLWVILTVYNEPWTSQHTLWILYLILLFYFFAELNDLHKLVRGYKVFVEIKKIFIAWFLSISVFAIVFLFTPQFFFLYDPSEDFKFRVWVLVVPFGLTCWHLLLRWLARNITKMGANEQRVAVIGATDMGKSIRTIIHDNPSFGMVFSGYFDDRMSLSKKERLAVEVNELNGNIRELVQLTKQGKIDIVFITLPMQAEQRIKTVLDALADSTASVYFVPNLLVFDLLRSQWSNFSGIPVVSIYDSPFYGVDGMVKRIFDIVLASFVLLIAGLPMLMVAIAIKLTSPGPILFKQRRYGFRGEEIIVWKFRSMSVCEDGPTITQAQKNDPRVTPIGNFIRRTSIDELPQFFHVLQGTMSIVGPRPHAVAHNELYREKIKGYMLRHKVKPGITGLAQINGFRGQTDTIDKMEGRVKYDLEYITQWSLSMDFEIFLLTIVKGFKGENAY